MLGAFNSLVAALASSESEAARVEFNLVYDVTPFVILPHTHYTGRRKKEGDAVLSG